MIAFRHGRAKVERSGAGGLPRRCGRFRGWRAVAEAAVGKRRVDRRPAALVDKQHVGLSSCRQRSRTWRHPSAFGRSRETGNVHCLGMINDALNASQRWRRFGPYHAFSSLREYWANDLKLMNNLISRRLIRSRPTILKMLPWCCHGEYGPSHGDTEDRTHPPGAGQFDTR